MKRREPRVAMGGGKRLDKAKASELHADGKSDRVIAGELGVAPGTVQAWRKRNDLAPAARADSGWSDERIAELKKLWSEGYSAGQIAGCLGAVSRSAVIGKVHRLGLSGRPTTSRKQKAKKPPKPKETKSRQPRSAYLFGKPSAEQFADEKPEPYVEAAEEIVIPEGQRKKLVDLEVGDCRWPIGDPRAEDFHFCAKQKVEGLPYCEFHARKAFQPPAIRRPAKSTGVTAGGQIGAGGSMGSGGNDNAAPGRSEAKEDA